jgi:hypothetical protein
MIEAGLPLRIEGNISVQQVGDETLVYDERRHKALCLNRTSSVVWRLCNGARTETQIAATATLELRELVSGELVRFALKQLQRDGLMQAMPSACLPVLSRRELAVKLGSRAIMLLPVIAAVMVPETARALSGGVDAVQQQNAARARQLNAVRAQQLRSAHEEDSCLSWDGTKSRCPPAQNLNDPYAQ